MTANLSQRPELSAAATIEGSQSPLNVIDPIERETLPLPLTGLILCGGRSKRMGRSKAFLPFAGITIIEHLIDTTRHLFKELFLVANEPDSYTHMNVDVVKDILPYRGPLGGILSGLLVGSYDHVFVMACDMPLIDQDIIRQMAQLRHHCDVVVLKHSQGVEPLLGIYHKNCIGPLEETLFAGNLKAVDFLAGLKAGTYDYPEAAPGSNSLPAYFNVNTPQDYTEVLTKLPDSQIRQLKQP